MARTPCHLREDVNMHHTLTCTQIPPWVQTYNDRSTRPYHDIGVATVEVFHMSRVDMESGWPDSSWAPAGLPGWYWWPVRCHACGYVPDSDPIGPFQTEAEALEDAQEGN